jgi:hypothetical protein
MLAEAMCKLMGFSYAPSQGPADYWRHGHSTERDFIYVTTQSLTHDALKKLSEEVGPERTLLICCKAFSASEAAFKNLTLKKIPQAVLTRCEWARDDYSLRVANLQPAPEEKADSVDGRPSITSWVAMRRYPPIAGYSSKRRGGCIPRFAPLHPSCSMKAAFARDQVWSCKR